MNSYDYMKGNQKETSRRPRNRNQYLYGISEVLALTDEALVPLRHKAVNGCLVKLPGLRCEPVPHVLLDVVVVVVRGESFAPQSLFLGDQKWRNRRKRSLDCMEGDRKPPTWISARVHDCVGRMRPCIVVEQNDPTGVGTTLCYTLNDIVTGLHIPNSLIIVLCQNKEIYLTR